MIQRDAFSYFLRSNYSNLLLSITPVTFTIPKFVCIPYPEFETFRIPNSEFRIVAILHSI